MKRLRVAYYTSLVTHRQSRIAYLVSLISNPGSTPSIPEA
jgi:hypothetical protein